MLRNRPTLWILLAILLLAGCKQNKDARLARMAQESTQRQAEQNQEIVRLNREVAQGTSRLIEADSQSRQELIALQHDLQDQQAEVGRQRDLLDTERKELALKRERESLLAVVFDRLGELALCALPLILCWYLLHGLWQNSDDPSVNEMLLEQLAAGDSPLRLRDSDEPEPRGSRLPHISQS